MYLALQGFLANTTLSLTLTSTDSISHTHTTHSLSHTHTQAGPGVVTRPLQSHICDYIHTVSKVNSHTVHTYDVRNCTTCNIVTCGMKI